MLPKNVEDQGAEADRLHAEIYGNPNGTKPEAPAPEAQQLPPPAQAEAKPVEQPAEEEPRKQLKAPPEKENDADYWRRRAEIMAGKYDNEVPRYAEELRKLRDEVAKLSSHKEQIAPQAQEGTVEVPEDLREKYGEEFISDMAKLMPHQAQPQSSVAEELDRIKKELAESRFNEFKKDLATKAPDMERLNTDREFNLWLDGIDMASGRPRRDLFNDAVSTGDSVRAAYFFNTFGGNNQSWDGQQQNAFTPPPVAGQVHPNHSHAAESPQAKKIWTSTEMEQFYNDLRKGKVNDADAARIENDIFNAMREGRVR